jgi:DNA-binding transcriptional MerR regulator
MSEYRIDELARQAGTTVRNVRAYQERGLLPPPRRQGRVGVFGDGHLQRLRLIGHLLDRGYSLANIGELLSAWEKGHAIHEVLGLTGTPVPERVDLAWLAEAFGTAAITDGDAVATALRTAVDLGILQPDPATEPGGDGFRVGDPRLLRAAIELVQAGVPLTAVVEHARELRRDVERLAERFVDLVDVNVFRPAAGDGLPTPAEAARLGELAQRLRPLADDVVIGELDRAIDRLVRQRLAAHLARSMNR